MHPTTITTGFLLAALALLPAAAAQSSTDPVPYEIDGTWDVDDGDATLEMRFTATLRLSRLDVVQYEGTVEGRTYAFTWSRRCWGVTTSGDGELTFGEDGASLRLVMRNCLITKTYDYEVDAAARTLTEV
jgi:hypothetical protein